MSALRSTRSPLPFLTLSMTPALGTVLAAVALWRQRRALARLDAHARRDLGLSEADIQRELARPVWPAVF